MPNTIYCNIIGTTDGELRDNQLLIGNAISKPIGEAAEEKALTLFKEYCVIFNNLPKEDTLNTMIENGVLESNDRRVKVFINWPLIVPNPSK